MKIFYIASESSPFIKTGGLADVAGSLPKEFAKRGNHTAVVLPLYYQIGEEYKSQMEFLGYYYVDLDWRRQYVGVKKLKYEGVDYYFLDNEYYFHRSSIYGQGDDGERFIFFNKAVTQLFRFLDIKPDIVHANDWHTGLVPLYIKDFARGDSFYHDIKTVFTIHNIKYQGIFKAEILPLTGLSTEYFHEDGIKYYDSINMMKAGIVYCDLLTTVSNTYAEEITYPYFGEGLDGIIRKYKYKLKGIVNGIDYDVYNPEKDKLIKYNYSVESLDEKIKNKKELQELYKLPVNPNIPVFSMVTRLVDLKGIDLLDYVLGEMLQMDMQLIVLGTGDSKYEDMLRWFERIFPQKLSANIYFSTVEAQKIYAGSDFYLMPSIAEPCGISQLISLRYGTVPIVRETGGLKDTVKPYNKYTGEGTGFGFSNINAHELLNTVRQAIEVYNNKDVYRKIQESGMNTDYSWNSSCQIYLDSYKELIR